MGSQPGHNEEELTVLVTGFGPFREQFPINPSWEIAKGLPTHLPPLRAKDPSSRPVPAPAPASDAAVPGPVTIPAVRIVTPEDRISVAYKAVRGVVPGFWDAPYRGHKIDVAIHIGMASARPTYQIERRAHRQGYRALDVDGKVCEDEGEDARGEDWIWHGLPDEMETDLDLDDVLKRWRNHSPNELDLCISEDAGRYLCDFIYYSSLAHLHKQNRPGKVVFFHVPADASEGSVAQGRELALTLIRSIVESEVSRKNAIKAKTQPPS